jgi:oligogalacturonide transporter
MEEQKAASSESSSAEKPSLTPSPKGQKPREERLSSKISYGFADIYGGASVLVINILFLVFLTNVVGLPGYLAGIIPLVGKIWDAVTDPVMGNICDRTRSKYGKKRVYLFWGSFAALISFVLMWIDISVKDAGVWWPFIFYLLMYMNFSTAFTIVCVPYNALLPDMVEDYTLRSKYTAVRMMFSAFAAILGGLLPNILVNNVFNKSAVGYLVTGIIFGALFLVAVLITFFGTWEKPSEPIKVPLKETFSESFSVFRNRSFRRYLGIFLFGQGSSDFVTSLAIYFIIVVLYPGSKDLYSKEYMYIMGAILGSQLLAMFIFNFILGKHSKKMPIYIGFPLRIAATMVLLVCVYMKVNVWVVAGLSFLAGIGTAASSVSSFAILTDTADIDELITSKRRAGICSGMATFTRKIAAGVAIWFSGMIVTWSGYDNAIAGVETDKIYALTFSESTAKIIGYCYVFVPIIMMVLCLLMTYLYPANKKEIQLVQKEIARRKGTDASVTTEEEKKTLEKLTGYKYSELWNPANANLSGRRKLDEAAEAADKEDKK